MANHKTRVAVGGPCLSRAPRQVGDAPQCRMADDALSPADELEQLRRRDSEAERKRIAEMNRLLRIEYRKAKTGSRRLVTPEQVEAKRAELLAADEDAGYDTLAGFFHVSPTTIRRALGKTK